MSQSFALTVNRQQLDIIRDALSDYTRIASPTRKQLVQDMYVQLDGLIGNWTGLFDVLGWKPELRQWVHLFTWTRGAQAGLQRAEADNARHSAGYTHFVIIPIPNED